MISKTRFVNLVRCPRYAALEDIHRNKEKAIVSFESLIEEENEAKKTALLDFMYDEEGEDLIDVEDVQLDTMMPYYNHIEVLSGKAIENKFGKNVTYNLDTFKQKRFEVFIGDYKFYCFLDGYQPTEKAFNVFETKATTSKKFLDLGYSEDKEFHSVFGRTPEGVLMLKERLGIPFNEAKYSKSIQKLYDPYSAQGRYVYDLAFQRFVIEKYLESVGLDVQKEEINYYLVVLNGEYVYDGKVDQQGKPDYDDNIMVFIDLTDVTASLLPQITRDVKQVASYLDALDADPCTLGKHCQRKDLKQCKFFPVCWGHVPEKNSIFTYIGSHNGFKDPNGVKHERFELINQGLVRLEDIPYAWLNREENRIQRDVVESQTPFYHYKKITRGVQTLKYPIYHLDFETFPCPLPRFFGEKPYSQSLFQYSIHIERKPGVCDKHQDHYGYLAKDHHDCREDLIKNMLDVILPDGGSVLVYNQSFEKTRLKEMAELFPQFKDRLYDLIDRLFDLMHIVKKHKDLYLSLGFSLEEAKLINFYHEDLNGSYSIKKVLPLFSHLTYKGMAVSNGNEALTTYARFPFMEPAEFQMKYQDLVEYCKQDTWAMYEILHALRKLEVS